MNSRKHFYLTTTLPYVNAELHLGHALEFIRADAVARYHQLKGEEVFFNSGTDEHGSKIFKRAEELGLPVQQFVNENVEKFYQSVTMFGLMEGVQFIRTTEPKHLAAAEAFWRRVAANGYIYKKEYQTKYCINCEEEKTDSELVDGCCPLHPDTPLELIAEENYFFKYSAFQKPLLDFYSSRPDFVLPDFRFNEMKAFVERGLEDFSISRLKSKMPWGIPVPDDPDQVMYVWFDALVSYIATLGWPSEEGDFLKYWIEGTPTQYCGKDNTRFQAAMWQAMLLAAGLPNSYQVIVNGFITAEGGVKMSKSLGNTTDPKELAEQYGIDALRFFLLSEVSNFEDSPFTPERFKDAYNAKLANGLGNLVSRVLKMTTTNNVELAKEATDQELPQAYLKAMDTFNLHEACAEVWHVIQEVDKRIQETKPFSVVKTDPLKAKSDMQWCLGEVYQVARMLEPLLPATAEQIRRLAETNQMPEAPLFLRRE